jgi:hypothetical protein
MEFAGLCAEVAGTSNKEGYLSDDRFILWHDSNLKQLYCPFELVATRPRVVLVGITPGLHQAWESVEIFGRTYATTRDLDRSLLEAEKGASFAGTMRSNLVGMLDNLGAHNYLGMQSTSELFAQGCHLAHTTSAIRYPMFRETRNGWVNYNGHSPKIDISSEPMKRALQDLECELAALERAALIIPLGKAASEILGHLDVSPHTLLKDFPHPSGSNGHRAKHFSQRRETLRDQVEHHFRKG